MGAIPKASSVFLDWFEVDLCLDLIFLLTFESVQ